MYDDHLQTGADRRDLLLAGAAAVLVTAVAFAVLEVLLIAVALGTADYSTGRPGPAGAAGFGVLTAVVGGLACAAGGYVGARTARLRSSPSGQARTTAVAAVLALVVVVLVLNITNGARLAAAALLLVGSVVGVLPGAAAGSRR